MFILNLVQNTNTVLDNLNASDKQLEDLNKEVVDLAGQYLADSQSSVSFFSLTNVYFWVVLGSLVLLAFGLILLLLELKRGSATKVKSKMKPVYVKPLNKYLTKQVEPEPESVPLTSKPEPEMMVEPKPVSLTEETPGPIAKKKPIKIKVVKVK